MSDPAPPRLIFLTGKGGVGKSTLAAALALEAARRGRQPLLFDVGAGASAATLFGVAPTHEPRAAGGVHVARLDLEASFEDWLRQRAKLGSIARKVATSESFARFLRAAPAVSEVLTLARLEALLARQGSAPGDGAHHDPIIVDLDASGHVRMFFEAPKVIAGLLGKSPLARLVGGAEGLLADPMTTRLCLVTTPETLPLSETLELAGQLREASLVPLGPILINRVPPRPLPAALDEALEARVDESEDIRRLHAALERTRQIEEDLGRLTPLDLPCSRASLRPGAGALDREALASLGREVGPALDAEPSVDPSTAAPRERAATARRSIEIGWPAKAGPAPEERLTVFVGPGGVGKTTLAAAFALDAARKGLRVGLITIDPARRLAEALGLSGLDDTLTPVPCAAGAFSEGGALEAAMLDTKASFDALIERITADAPETRARILRNRVYQSFSATLARSHAYVAMERLASIWASGGYDLIVLDTPPAASALEILDAPERLLGFLDEGALGRFLGGIEGGPAAWLRARAGDAAFALLGRLGGATLARELAEFLGVFLSLRSGFVERAESVRRLLGADVTSFALVSAPQRSHLADARALLEGLVSRGLEPRRLLLNRAFHPDESGAPVTAAPRKRSADAIEEAAASYRDQLASENDALAEAGASLAADLPHAEVSRLPWLDQAPLSVEGLAHLWASGR